jgi:hypothetical protein
MNSRKKLLLLLSIILMAGGLLILMELVNRPSNPASQGGPGVATPETAIRQRITSLSNNSWDKNEFDAIQSRIKMFKAQGVINVGTATTLNTSLDKAYVISINNSYSKWKAGGCLVISATFESSIRSFLVGSPQYSADLTQALSSFEKKRKADAISSKVDALLGKSYDESAFDALYAEINTLTGDPAISNCQSVKETRKVQLQRLSDFKNFAAGYTAAYKLYQSNPKVWAFAKDFISYCTNPGIGKYPWYTWHFESLDVC